MNIEIIILSDKIKKLTFWEKVDKKKFLIVVLLLLALLLLITAIILVVLLNGGHNEKEEKEERDEGEGVLSSIGEIICEYIVSDPNKNTKILSDDFIKNSKFQIFINNSLVNYNKEYKLDKNGTLIVFKLQENINMDSMFKDIGSLSSISLTSTKDAKITSMISTFENCYNLETINLNGFNTEEIKSMSKLFKRS